MKRTIRLAAISLRLPITGGGCSSGGVTKRKSLGLVFASLAVFFPILALAQRPAGVIVAWGHDDVGQVRGPAGVSGVFAIAAGTRDTVALKRDGTVTGWGNYIEENWTPFRVPSGLNHVVGIAAGYGHILARRDDGTAVGWGWNHGFGTYGEFVGQATVPVGLTGVTAIGAGWMCSVALKQDGTVVAWGQLFDGVWFIPATAPRGLTGVTAIAVGSYYCLALKQDGTVVAWGCVYDDRIGYMPATAPKGLTGVAAIAAGGDHGLALKQDGTVVAWGANDFGQATVPGGLKGVIAIAAGQSHSLALKQDGTVVAWGRNDYGQATVPAGLKGVIAIAGGGVHSVALINPVPTIRKSPQPQTAETGSTVRFSVLADGPPPLSYQWFYRGTETLAGANASHLDLLDVKPVHVGDYTVVITNLFGAVTSAPAMLNVIPAVERRSVPALTLIAQPSASLNVEYANSLESPVWTPLSTVTLTASAQFFFDLTSPLPSRRFYRAYSQGSAPGLDLHMAQAIALTGAIGSSVRLDYINQFGPTDAWTTLATVTLTNTSQLFFDTSAIGQPPRLYRLVNP